RPSSPYLLINKPTTTKTYTLSLHDALPISENLRMGAELDVTRKLQYMLLPTAEELRQIADLDIACYMEPAAEVGGDYYDVRQHRSEEHTSELQSLRHLVCRLLLEKKKRCSR